MATATDGGYAGLSRDSGAGLDIEPTNAGPQARAAAKQERLAGGSPVAAGEEDPLVGKGTKKSDAAAQDKEEHIDWTSPPNPELGETYRKVLIAQAELTEDGERGVLDVDQGYEKIDPKSIVAWPLWDTNMDELGDIGGQGVRVYFELLKRLPMLFLKLAILNTPSLYLNLYGEDNMYDAPGMTKQYRSFGARSTLGSVYAPPESLSAGKEMDMFVRTVLDGLSVLVLLHFVLTWQTTQDKLAAEADAGTITMADYTVSIRPPAGWLSLKDEKFNRADEEKTQEKEFIAKLKEDIENFVNEPGSVATTGDDTTEPATTKPAIWLAYDESKTIKLSQKKSQAMLALEVALAKAHKAKWDGEATKQVEAAASTCTEINTLLDEARKVEGGGGAEVVEAYVTFENSKQKDDAVNAKTMEFHGHTCLLREPPEPEALFWDRLHVQPAEQKKRSCAILTATIIVLICGFLGVLQADVMKGNLDYLVGCTDQMTVDPSAPNGTLGYCDPFTMQENELDAAGIRAQEHYSNAFHELVDELGMDGQFPRAVSVRSDAAGSTYPDDYQCAVTESEDMEGCCEYDDGMSWQAAKADGCHRIDAHATTKDIDGVTTPVVESEMFRYADKDSICYMCLCECEDPEPGKPGYDASAPGCTPTIDDEYCDGYRDYRSHLKTFKLLATFIVVAINAVIKKLIVGTQPMMGLHDVGKDMGSIAFRVFLLQLCMTGILVVLLRADVPGMSALPSEKFQNVCAKWYSAVGAPLIKTMTLNFCVPPCAHLMKTSVFNILGRVKAGKAITQNQMNQAYKSTTKDWNLAASYGELLLPMFIILAYSSGVPLLLWIGCFGFTLKFWVEKWCMLRRYQKPPLIDDDMFNQFGGLFSIMSAAIVIKGLIGIWLYASAGGISPSHEYHAHLVRPHVLPFIAVVVVAIATWIAKTCCFRTAKATRAPEKNPPFSVALNENELANRDPDYEIDQFEEEESYERAFGKALVKYASLKDADSKKMKGHVYMTVVNSVWDGEDDAKEKIVADLRKTGVLDDADVVGAAGEDDPATPLKPPEGP